MKEEVLFETSASRGVRITATNAKLAGVSYPVNGITSVRILRRPSTDSNFWNYLLGALFAAGGLVGASTQGHALFSGKGLMVGPSFASALAVLFGLVITIKSAKRKVNRNPVLTVVIGTSGGERDGIVTSDEDLANTVVDALERAVAARG